MYYLYVKIENMTTLEVNRDYEILPQEFMGKGKSQGGWRFRQLQRVGNIALYEKSDDDGNTYWEVVVIEVSSGGETTIAGRKITFSPKELYPSNEAFGTRGWCFALLDSALQVFNQLIATQKTLK